MWDVATIPGVFEAVGVDPLAGLVAAAGGAILLAGLLMRTARAPGDVRTGQHALSGLFRRDTLETELAGVCAQRSRRNTVHAVASVLRGAETDAQLVREVQVWLEGEGFILLDPPVIRGPEPVASGD